MRPGRSSAVTLPVFTPSTRMRFSSGSTLCGEQQRLLQQAERIAGLERPVDVAGTAARAPRSARSPAPPPCARAGRRARSRRGRAGRSAARITAARKRLGKLRRKPCSCSCAWYSRLRHAHSTIGRSSSGRPWFSWCLSTIEARYMHGQHVAEARRQVLLLLQVAAERQHRDVDREGERGAEAHDVLVVARGRALHRARA